MWKIILNNLGLLKKYTVVYNDLICNSSNKPIDFYYFKYCPKELLQEKALEWIKGKVLTVVNNVIYIESIGIHEYKKQFIY